MMNYLHVVCREWNEMIVFIGMKQILAPSLIKMIKVVQASVYHVKIIISIRIICVTLNSDSHYAFVIFVIENVVTKDLVRLIDNVLFLIYLLFIIFFLLDFYKL